MVEWIKTDEKNFPEEGEIVLLYDGTWETVGLGHLMAHHVVHDKLQTLWEGYIRKSDAPPEIFPVLIRNISWWAKIEKPNFKATKAATGGGPVTHRDGTVIGAFKI